MSTTVVHPGSVSGHGPSGRTIGTAVAGVVVAAALGFAIVNQSAPEAGVSQGTVEATVTQADFVAHTESLAGELQALQGVGANAQELAQARRVAEIQAMNEYPANSGSNNEGPGLEPGASGIR